MATNMSGNQAPSREKKVTPLMSGRESLRRTDRANAFMQDLRLRIANLLQTTLESELIVQYFFQEIQAAVAVDGMVYRHSVAALRHEQGKTGKHRARYRLTTHDSYFGDVEFTRRQRFSEAELAKLESLLDLFVYPMRNALKYQEALRSALTDPLTGAGNRLALTNALGREIELCRRYGRQLSILVLDIDRFKNINDLFGHNTGDQVLKRVTEITRNSLRDADSLYRMGGEEFLILMSATDLDAASLIGERVRDNVRDCSMGPESAPNVTVSVGAAEFDPAMSMDDLINAADNAMYRAKHLGRDQVQKADHAEI